MPDFVLKARTQYTPRGELGRFVQSRIAPAARAGIEHTTKILFDATQTFVPVRDGELKASGKMEIVETDKTVVGNVIYTAKHAAYNEFGTGIRGQATGGDPTITYRSDWPGMEAHPYLRPGLDLSRNDMFNGFASEMSAGLKKGF